MLWLTDRLNMLAFAVCMVIGLVVRPAFAEGPVILTVVGKAADETIRAFTREDLEDLEQVEVVTATPWHDGVERFEGPLLNVLLEEAGARGVESISVLALNDYAATIPMEDIREYHPILALKHNGAYMTVENKGPLFVIYPFDSNAKLQAEIYYSRSVWQVKSIAIK